MSNQAKPHITLFEALECDEMCSPHWPKTLVSTSSINTQPPMPNNNARQNQKSLSAYLKKLRLSRR